MVACPFAARGSPSRSSPWRRRSKPELTGSASLFAWLPESFLKTGPEFSPCFFTSSWFSRSFLKHVARKAFPAGSNPPLSRRIAQEAEARKLWRCSQAIFYPLPKVRLFKSSHIQIQRLSSATCGPERRELLGLRVGAVRRELHPAGRHPRRAGSRPTDFKSSACHFIGGRFGAFLVA